MPPDINFSEYRFRPVSQGDGQPVKEIRYGLGAVRGSGESAIEAVVQARKDGPFTDLFDFCSRIDRRQVNRRTIDSLIRAGAMDCFGQNRAVLLASVQLALEAAEQAESSANQGNLFGGEEAVLQAVEYVKATPWTEKQTLQEEKEALGFCMSGHLFHAYEKEAAQFGHVRIASLAASREARWVAGIIASVRNQMSQRGKMMVVTLDDGSGTVEVTVFSELLEQKQDIFTGDAFLLVFGKVSEDRFSGGLRITADEVLDIAGARRHFYKHLRFSLTEQMASVDRLKEQLLPHLMEDGLPLLADFQAAGCRCELVLGDAWRVNPTDACLQTLQALSQEEGG